VLGAALASRNGRRGNGLDTDDPQDLYMCAASSLKLMGYLAHQVELS
jgi:hypothetical protein